MEKYKAIIKAPNNVDIAYIEFDQGMYAYYLKWLSGKSYITHFCGTVKVEKKNKIEYWHHMLVPYKNILMIENCNDNE